MAHPYKAHSQQKVASERVSHVMKSAGYARGGKVKHHTTVNVVVPKGGDAPPAGPAGAVGPPPMAAPAPPMPMMPPPGGPPPGGPPMPMPMRKSGGRVGGDASAKNIKGWSKHAAKNSYARGGRLPTAGQDSGEGRLQLHNLHKGKRK